jgi:hypothetical protein
MTSLENLMAAGNRHMPALRDFKDSLYQMGFSPSGLVSLLGLKHESRLYPLE